MIHEYGKFIGGMAIGSQEVFSGKNPWKPSEPEANSILWRYMSFAKFCSLLDRKALFFSFVGEMEDRYEGFIYPPKPREHGDSLHHAERIGQNVLREIARTALVSCWTESVHESSLMWEAYAGAEDEVRAILPGPPWDVSVQQGVPETHIPLDSDVAEQRGRYIPVDLEILVQEIVLPPHTAPWFAQVVQSVMDDSSVRSRVTRSSIESPPTLVEPMNYRVTSQGGD